MQSQRGFTLIEIIVTVSILALLVASGTIVIGRSIAENDLRSAAITLVSNIRNMQQLSLDKQSTDAVNNVNITFNTNSYQITTNRSTGTVLPAVRLPNNITVSNNTPLTYDHNALSTNARAMVTLTSSSLTNNNKRTIVISAVTGRIRIDPSDAPAYRPEE